MLKLLICDQLGVDSSNLVRAQRRAFADLFDATGSSPPTTDIVATWRHYSVAAVAAFLEALDRRDT